MNFYKLLKLAAIKTLIRYVFLKLNKKFKLDKLNQK